MLVTFAAAMLFFAGSLAFLGQRQRRLSRRRPNLDAEAFVRSLGGGCDPLIGGWVYRQLDVHLPDYLKPHPSDRIMADLAIDPDDYCAIGREHFTRWALPQPWMDDPEVLPDDPTVAEFVRYLTLKMPEKDDRRSRP